ncbi:hypothetical protein ATANTOWER_029725 [Ataeniobius toweri]|uniref:Uncharacterized protein n=1 Tax=Ataeniobius toweri TaxID=208326 RepID=A0ABU7AC06_9TELE|nr:hypothetical protein [Ataeniobius toweri]
MKQWSARLTCMGSRMTSSALPILSFSFPTSAFRQFQCIHILCLLDSTIFPQPFLSHHLLLFFYASNILFVSYRTSYSVSSCLLTKGIPLTVPPPEAPRSSWTTGTTAQQEGECMR